MFGKSYRESKSEESPETTILSPLSANNPPMDNAPGSISQRDAQLQSSIPQTESEIEVLETPEVVNTVEKISLIATPYFIAIIGLSLYKENVLIGTILIGIGIISLLKVSTKDIASFFTWIKSFLGFDENQP